MDNLDEIFVKSYLKEYSEKEKQRVINSQEDRDIAKQKKQQLAGMEAFLKKFVDLEILVHHYDQYTRNSLTSEGRDPQKFSYYLVDSSKKWSPGISIFFDHPAQVEIAIPNKPEEEGVIVIKVASHHPNAYMVEQRFMNFESAYEAIGRFLGRSTVKINKDPRKYLEKVVQTPKKHIPQDYDFTNDVPDHPPIDDDIVISRKNQPIEKEIGSLKRLGELFQINKNKDKDKSNSDEN